jgi:hypothetical protein
MKSGRLLTVVVTAVVLLTACSGGEIAVPSLTQESSTPKAKSAAVLDGVYRLDFDLRRQLRNGAPDVGKPFAQVYAFRSNCDGDKCIAVGRRLRDDDRTQPAEQPVVVLDFVNGQWVATIGGKSACGGGHSPVLQSWSLKPGADGKLTGTRRLAFFSLECGSAYEQPVTATRTGDVDPGLTMPDPAKEPPLKSAAAEGFRGRYDKSLTAKDGQKTPDVPVDVSTTCIRNAQHCLTYVGFTAPGSRDRSVRAYQFQGKIWTGDAKLLTKCTSGADVVETTYSEWGLPDPVADPFPRLTGTQREVYPPPCVGAVVSDVLMVRIGD